MVFGTVSETQMVIFSDYMYLIYRDGEMQIEFNPALKNRMTVLSVNV